MIQIERYNPTLKSAWNQFNAQAKNGTFLFDRNYMDYHQDRFQDHSLLFYQGQQLVALLPLNEAGNEVFSHAGLTFGGLVVGARIDIYLYLQIFELLLQYLRDHKFVRFTYKTIPFIFHQVFAFEDMYALYRCNAKLASRNLSSCIELQNKINYTKGRRWSLKQAQKANLELNESQAYGPFMELVNNILQHKYGVKPTHTASEIEYLARRFPQNIKLLVVCKEQEILGGCIIYISAQVIHLQYIATTDVGKKLHVLDLILHQIIQTYKKDKKYINFGISPGSDSFGLNTGLIKNKESYGARSLPHDVYEIML